MKPDAPREITRKEMLLEEYKMIQEFDRDETHVHWQRHNVYLVVNTGLVAALALAAARERSDATLVAGAIPVLTFLKSVCIAGVCISVAWLVTNFTGAMWCLVFGGLMREIEDNLDTPTKFMHRVIPPRWSRPWFLRVAVSVRLWSSLLPLAFLFLWGYCLWWAMRASR
jgi:hypothetical protein